MAPAADEDYYLGDRGFKRPNLQSRLQSGMNLQICFMNEASDHDNGEAKLSPPKQDKVRFYFVLIT